MLSSAHFGKANHGRRSVSCSLLIILHPLPHPPPPRHHYSRFSYYKRHCRNWSCSIFVCIIFFFSFSKQWHKADMTSAVCQLVRTSAGQQTRTDCCCIELMRQQITMCPIKHSKARLSYFLSFAASFLFNLASCVLLSAPFSHVRACLSLPLVPPFCEGKVACVCEKLNISGEIGFLWRNRWITLCSWRQ